MLGRFQLSSQFRNIHLEPIVTRVPITVERPLPMPDPVQEILSKVMLISSSPGVSGEAQQGQTVSVTT